MRKVLPLTLALALLQTGCLVAGYRSGGGGWFIWPGGLGLLLIILVLLFLARRRR